MGSVSVRLRAHKGLLCKSIGQALGKDGLAKKKTFYFDASDPNAAMTKCLELKAEWRRLRAAGKTVWNESPVYQEHCRSRPDKATGAKSVAVPVTVAGAAKLYLGQLERQLAAGQVKQSHVSSQTQRLNKALEILNPMPLSVVGERHLQEAVLRLAQRPTVKRLGKDAKNSMSVSYARASLATLKWFFLWCDESDQVRWQKSGKIIVKSHVSRDDDGYFTWLQPQSFWEPSTTPNAPMLSSPID